MKHLIRAAFVAALVLFAAGGAAAQTGAAKGGEKTVEESYLQESLETMIIKEQSQSETKDMKLVALKYIRQAIDGGRKNAEIAKSLEYMALETTNTIVRSAGLGRPTNNFPDVRAKAAEYLGEFPTVESKDALIKVTLGDNEPMVLSKAIQSLGKIGMNDDGDVTQVIAYIVNRFDVLYPDDSLAFEAMVAIGNIADKNNGIKDPAAYKAVMKVMHGNYITPVKRMAEQVLDKLRKYQAASK